MSSEIIKPSIKFLIGFFAGLAVTIIPKLSAALNTDAGSFELYFPPNLVIAIVVFSLILGGIMMIVEHDIPKPPKETFFAALAIPGILVGTLNTTVEDAAANRLKQREQSLLEQIVTEKGIPSSDVGFIKKISEGPEITGYNFSFELIGVAHAESQNIEPAYKGYSTIRETPRYSVVLREVASREEALEQVKILREKVPGAVAVETDEGYKILASEQLLDRYNAVKLSLEMDKRLNEKTGIIRYK